MKTVKDFFDIKRSYRFEIYDLTALVSFFNVALIILGFWWAPFLGLTNCVICILFAIKKHLHINTYITQVSLIILNLFFLKG